MGNAPTLEDLRAELRQNAANDVDFAQRVSLARIAMIESKADSAAAIRATSGIQ